MRKLALAILVAATPAVAQNGSDVSYEVRFKGVTFTCGQTGESEGSRRFMYATPSARYLPVLEPASEDANAQSWSIVHKIICEQAFERQAANRREVKAAAVVDPKAKPVSSRKSRPVQTARN
jgi:hypothetical protein